MTGNERGLTLVEVLAAITISVFILGTASLLLFSVLRLSNSSAAAYHGDMTVRTTLQQWSKLVSESCAAVYIPAQQELRVRRGGEYYSFVLTGSTFRRFRYTNDGNASNDGQDFADASVSVATHPLKYTEPLLLSEQARSVRYFAGNTDTSLPSPSVYGSGGLIRAEFTFRTVNRVDVRGTEHAADEIRTSTVKLLNDWTSK